MSVVIDMADYRTCVCVTQASEGAEHAQRVLYMPDQHSLTAHAYLVSVVIDVADCRTCVYGTQVSEGVEYAQKVVDMPDRHPLTARAYLLLGVGYSLMSDEVRLQSHRQNYQKQAVEAFHK